MESALATQKLRPTIDAIKRQYGDDRKAVQRETSALYEASGVSPTAGACIACSLRLVPCAHRKLHSPCVCAPEAVSAPGPMHTAGSTRPSWWRQ